MRPPLPVLLACCTLLPLAIGCDGLAQAFCGGDLDEYCGEHDCVWTWEEALLKAESDTGDRELVGCTEGDMLMAHGYLVGRTQYYDGASGALSAVVEWSDVEEYCSDSSFTRTWGEQPACTWECSYQEENASEQFPICEEGPGT